MQFKKTEIEDALVRAAREEFLAKGFNDASIRTITQNAGVARSNLYNYFANKDALFTAVVHPTIVEIRQGIKFVWDIMICNEECIPSLEKEMTEGWIMVEFIDIHREDLALILLKSAGSSVEQFREELQEEYQKMHSWYFNYVKAQFPDRMKNTVSPFFIHALSAWMLHFVTEVISHGIPRDEMLGYMEECVLFYYYGQLGILEH
ncbi:MAG: TetR/AcrR family transcriptional regulator [Candidatus Vecturithrix sp.]|jgi:AcrR family transcriptional regulator|nr:TetR/AcrR family transcriptional regulator [Candidatus Vecturithrix sp.]